MAHFYISIHISRHLGEYRLKFGNKEDYSLFISTYLDKNVVSDFRYRKIMPFEKDGEKIQGMKIVALDTEALKEIIRKDIKYGHLYKVFEKYHNLPLETIDWHDRMVEEVTASAGLH